MQTLLRISFAADHGTRRSCSARRVGPSSPHVERHIRSSDDFINVRDLDFFKNTWDSECLHDWYERPGLSTGPSIDSLGEAAPVRTTGTG